MAKTKMKIRKKRAILKTFSLGLSLLVFLLVFFELSLTTHGGWDDINFGIIFACPFIAAVAMLFAIVNHVKFHSKTHEIIPALSMVGVSALFFCYVMVCMTTIVLTNS
jgi:hypothetical protein